MAWVRSGDRHADDVKDDAQGDEQGQNQKGHQNTGGGQWSLGARLSAADNPIARKKTWAAQA